MVNIATERLVLRPLETADAAHLHATLFCDPVVCEHFCGPTWTLAEVTNWVGYHRLDTRWGDIGYLAIVRRADEAVLGVAGLRPYVANWSATEAPCGAGVAHLETELSYALGQEHWGQGYATEACGALVHYAFETLRLPRIAYGVHVDNTRSWQLMKRLGFRFVRHEQPTNWDSVVGILDHPALRSVED